MARKPQWSRAKHQAKICIAVYMVIMMELKSLLVVSTANEQWKEFGDVIVFCLTMFRVLLRCS